MMVITIVATACSNDEDEDTVEYTSHAYISSVTMGMVKRTIMVEDSLGKPVPESTSFSAGDVLMSINQRTRVIENHDSLLYGSHVERILVTIKYTGIDLAYRPVGNTDEKWTTYRTTDSVDLSKPLQLRVTANDGKSETLYTLKVNIHQQDGDSLKWNHVQVADDLFGSMAEMKATCLNGRVMVLGKTGTEIQLAEANAQGDWKKQSTNLPINVELQTLRCFNGKAYISTADGSLYTSTDAAQWAQLGTSVDGLQLIAVTSNRLYAKVGNSLRRADLDASNWDAEESLDGESADNLPTNILDAVVTTRNNGAQRITMVGESNSSTDSTLVVWSKLWSSEKKQDASPWMFYNLDEMGALPCPRLRDFNMMHYNDNIMALGGAPKTGFSGSEALDYFYTSKDNGLTWRTEFTLRLPKEAKGATTPIATTVDDEHYIWIITGNNVWRGRLNRLGFARQ